MPKKTEAASEQTRDSLLRKAYGSATQELRENHRDEFDDLYEKHAKGLGVEYKRKPKPEDKAAEQIEELLTQFPHLREKFASEPEAQRNQGGAEGMR